MIVFPELGRVGRLGNQLFQFAATYGIAASRGTIPMFPDDWAYRPYFSVPEEYFAPYEVLGELGRHATEFVPHINPQARIYLQDLGLFADHLDAVRAMLQPSAAADAELSTWEGFRRLAQPVLAVHVRRGDNVKDPGVPDKWRFYPVPGEKYYLAGIEALRDRAASIACFSDDILWCYDRLPDLDYYHDGTPRPKEHEPAWLSAPVLDWIDLLLMARCRYHVIGNSTYGVWGALLSDDPDTIIPDPWYGPALDYIDADLQFPATWRKLNIPLIGSA